MNGSLILLILAVVPMLCAPLAWALGRRGGQRAIAVMIACSAVEVAALIWLTALAAGGNALRLTWEGFLGMGIRMRADGFRALYAMIASVMWLVTSLFSRDYLRHDHATGRYAFFTLMTLGATAGLFLSDSLYTAFLFFEVMSLASYPWVAHEETPEAMRAAQTYLYIAVIGGLVMLMGIFLLPARMATLPFSSLPAFVSAYGFDALWLPAVLILFGFGAKGRLLPAAYLAAQGLPGRSGARERAALRHAQQGRHLRHAGAHLLPDARLRGLRRPDLPPGRDHHVPGRAAGHLLHEPQAYARVLVAQPDWLHHGGRGPAGPQRRRKRAGGLRHHPAHGQPLAVQAGAVPVRGRGGHERACAEPQRGARLRSQKTAAALLLPDGGMLGIAGIPGFSGYASKSLLHEGLLEYIHELTALGEGALPYQIAEWVFIISGGMTLCYMFKLYLCLFWQKNPTRQAEYDGMRKYLSAPSGIALGLCAALIPVLGLLPGVLMSGIGELARPFFNAAAPAHMPIAYFSGENLLARPSPSSSAWCSTPSTGSSS